MDLKKEIKLSDLFKRRPKEAVEEAAPSAEEAAEEKRASFLKREISFGRKRGADDATETKPEKSPKEAKPKREKSRGRGRGETTQRIPAVPLMRAFNLLPQDDARQSQGKRRPSTAQLVLAVAGLVLIALLGSVFLISHASAADKQRERDDLQAQVDARAKQAADPASAAPAADNALVQERDGRTAALSSALGARIAWDRLLRDLSLVLPDDVWLKSLRGSTAAVPDPAAAPPGTAPAGASSFEIQGYTRSQDGVAQLLSRMAVLPEVESVKLVSATEAVVARENLVEFVISAVVKQQVPAGVTT